MASIKEAKRSLCEEYKREQGFWGITIGTRQEIPVIVISVARVISQKLALLKNTGAYEGHLVTFVVDEDDDETESLDETTD